MTIALQYCNITQPLGPRDCAFRDPSGNMVRISQEPTAQPQEIVRLPLVSRKPNDQAAEHVVLRAAIEDGQVAFTMLAALGGTKGSHAPAPRLHRPAWLGEAEGLNRARAAAG